MEKDLTLPVLLCLLGGLFLIYKSVKEIHGKLEGEDPNVEHENRKGISLGTSHCTDYAD